MTRKIKIGDIFIGGGERIAVQSMTNTKTTDVDGTLEQLRRLKAAGCDIARCSVPDKASADALKEIVKGCDMPVVADIHFDYRLAVAAAQAGAAKIRINPGNIGDKKNVEYLAAFLKERGVPIRIGVNGGSLEKKFEGLPLDDAMVESALSHAKLLKDCGFYDTVISVKSSNVRACVSAYRKLSKRCDYPLHVGVTEAGIYEKGLVKSSIGIGALLLDGIGDTIRVSLTDDPVKEVHAANEILKAIDLYRGAYAEVVACPTCARTCIDVKGIATAMQEYASSLDFKLKIAVMGCVVNGLGEGKDSDIGVAGGKDKSVIFKGGNIVRTVANEDILTALKEEIESLRKNY